MSASMIVNDLSKVVKNAFDLFQEGSKSKQVPVSELLHPSDLVIMLLRTYSKEEVSSHVLWSKVL